MANPVKFFTDINLNTNQLKRAAIETATSNPSTPVTGQIYYNTSGSGTSNKRLHVYDGTSFVSIPYTGSIINADITNSTIQIGKIDTTSVTLSSVGTPTGSVSFGGYRITNVLTDSSSASTDAATKGYVDAAVANLNIHAPAVAATTPAIGNIGTYTAGSTGGDGGTGVEAYLTISSGSGTYTLDGQGLKYGDRILIKNQTTTTQNGLYVVSSSSSSFSGSGNAGTYPLYLIRDTDYDGSIAGEVASGDYILVINGTVNTGTSWIQATANPVVVGTSNITFTQFSSVTSYTAASTTATGGPGGGLKLTSTAFAIDTDVTVDKTTAQTLTNKTLTSPKLSGSSTGYTTFASNNSGATNYTITFPDATGTVALTSGTSINGTSVTLGTTNTITAAAGTLTGTTLNSTVVSSSLTSVGTIATGVWNGTDIAVADGGTGANTASAARTNLAAQTSGSGNALATKFAGPITNNTSSPITVNHKLGTTDVTVQVYETSGGTATNLVFTDVAITDANNITVSFASQDSAVYRVVVTG